MAGKVIASLGLGGKMSTTAVNVRMKARVESTEMTATGSYVSITDGAAALKATSGDVLKLVINGTADTDDIKIRYTDTDGGQVVETFSAPGTFFVGPETGDTFELKVK